MARQVVEERVGKALIAEGVAPFVEGQVRDDGSAALVALGSSVLISARWYETAAKQVERNDVAEPLSFLPKHRQWYLTIG